MMFLFKRADKQEQKNKRQCPLCEIWIERELVYIHVKKCLNIFETKMGLVVSPPERLLTVPNNQMTNGPGNTAMSIQLPKSISKPRYSVGSDPCNKFCSNCNSACNPVVNHGKVRNNGPS